MTRLFLIRHGETECNSDAVDALELSPDRGDF